MPRAADPSEEQPVTRAVLFDAQLAKATYTSHVEIREIRIAPGHAAGVHVHNGPVVGSIVDGSVFFQVGDQPESVLRPGDVFYEPEGERIVRFDAGDEGATFLAYFLLGDGQVARLDMLGE